MKGQMNFEKTIINLFICCSDYKVNHKNLVCYVKESNKNGNDSDCL